MILQILAVLCLISLGAWVTNKLGLWAFSIVPVDSCEDCDGTGKYTFRYPTAKWQEPADYDTETIDCETCNSTGRGLS